MVKRRPGFFHFAFNSLLGEILLWLITLLLFLWVLSVVTTYQVANSVANRPYDEHLAGDLAVVASHIREVDGKIKVNLPKVVEDLIRAQAKDRVYLQVLGPKGELIFGDSELPWVDASDSSESNAVRFRDEDIDGGEVRIAYQFLPLQKDAPALLVQIGETRQKRQALAASMVSAVTVPQFIIVPVAVLLVYLALTRGITPLQRLQEELRRRRPSNLTPIDVKGIPDEIRPLIEALNDVMTRLDSNLGAQRRFIADAAHQMKTPLTGLRSQIELVLGESDPQVVARSLRHIAQSTENLSRLVQQLLSLARAEAIADRGAVFSTVEVNVLAREVAAEWARKALDKNIDLGFEPCDHELQVSGAPLLIREMLGNLVDNAIKYTPAGGCVTVRTLSLATARGTTAVVEVEDSGVGIPAEERAMVIDRFYRVLGNESDGSGLGLSIVKEIADLHEASLSIEDTSSGKGIRVRVAFTQLKPA
jgi:two-component system sensor histidine kinase TctE